MSQKFSTFVNMINNKSNIEMQLATYKSMLTKASNDLAKSKQLVGLLKQQIEQGDTELSEELDKVNERISMLSEDLSDANARIYVLEVALTPPVRELYLSLLCCYFRSCCFKSRCKIRQISAILYFFC